jgi:hypothetical protein
LYPDFEHDLVHEPGGARVVEDWIQWLDAHTGGSGAPPSDTPPETLKGDHGGASTTVRIDARTEHPLSSRGALAATGGLRLRQGFGRVGWLGGLDLRAGSESGFRWEADAHPLGFGARVGHAQLGLTGGIGLLGLDGTTFAHVPAEVLVELPAGPLRLMANASLAWRLNEGGPGTRALGLADEARAFAGVRLGRDLRYWADVSAGQGPFLGVTYSRRDDATLWGISLGIDLWGAR